MTTDFGGTLDFANALAIQADKKIVAAGGSGSDFALARYNSDGTLDASFNPGGSLPGTVRTDFGGNDSAEFVTLDGEEILAIGSGGLTSSAADFALARYLSDGTLDGTFGNGGKVTTDFGVFGPGTDQGLDGAIQADGKILAVGAVHLENQQGDSDFGLARYNADGTPDKTFSADGEKVVDFDLRDRAHGVALLPTGDIIAAGTTFSGDADFAVGRLNPDGSLDDTFHGDGKVTTDFGADDIANDVLLQADGKIVAGGFAATATFADFGLARYLGEGGSPGAGCTIVGTSGDDMISGSNLDDVICASGGNDSVSGRGGDDTILGGDGNDSLKGGSGADDHFGEAGADNLNARDAVSGNDTLDGGSGTDRCRADPADTVTNCP